MMVFGERTEGAGLDAEEARFRQTEEEWDNLADITAEFQGGVL
jgi:hypothetical protein